MYMLLILLTLIREFNYTSLADMFFYTIYVKGLLFLPVNYLNKFKLLWIFCFQLLFSYHIIKNYSIISLGTDVNILKN